MPKTIFVGYRTGGGQKSRLEHLERGTLGVCSFILYKSFLVPIKCIFFTFISYMYNLVFQCSNVPNTSKKPVK